jgi:small-conductance mechanosensitive channel
MRLAGRAKSFPEQILRRLSDTRRRPLVTHDTSLTTAALNQSNDSGKALAALLIYLVAFVLALLLFVHGLHSVAFLLLIAVWAMLASWLQKGGR